MAILYSAENPEMDVNIRTDDQFLSSLVAGPAIIPQLLMQLAYHSAKKDDIRTFNDMIFDLNIGEVLCEKLNTKFQLCSYFHVVPQESITKNKVVWKLLEKKVKDLKDYKKIGAELNVDTILEINVLSYGLKDPGIFSDPYATLKVDVKMTTAFEGKVLWRDIIEAKTAIGMDTIDFVDIVYGDVQYLKEEMEKVADIFSEKCIERLGFDTNYTYLLDEDYMKRMKNNVNIAEKLNELNVMRHEDLITNADYDETKINLIEKARKRKSVRANIENEQNVTEKQ
ncbi:MAG: hypothetical protein SCARUB_02043 [Candidatus Scalindua rubra]|uniref:Uncharacterized protein n=1 Tax=Candidatus Scalindua rubra TaxID=1872076 RepID=A0A1E3XB13_9BACT|nr:MAG: hypothetical protein SCARUB_02043 [Candidatus Scalindua rubra]